MLLSKVMVTGVNGGLRALCSGMTVKPKPVSHTPSTFHNTRFYPSRYKDDTERRKLIQGLLGSRAMGSRKLSAPLTLVQLVSDDDEEGYAGAEGVNGDGHLTDDPRHAAAHCPHHLLVGDFIADLGAICQDNQAADNEDQHALQEQRDRKHLGFNRNRVCVPASPV